MQQHVAVQVNGEHIAVGSKLWVQIGGLWFQRAGRDWALELLSILPSTLPGLLFACHGPRSPTCHMTINLPLKLCLGLGAPHAPALAKADIL